VESAIDQLAEFTEPLLRAGYTVFGIRHRETSTDTIQALRDDVRHPQGVAANGFPLGRAAGEGLRDGRLQRWAFALLACQGEPVAGVIAWAPPTDLRD